MNTRLLPAPQHQRQLDRMNWLDRMARHGFISRMKGLRHGQVILTEGDHVMSFGNLDKHDPEAVIIEVHSPQFYSDIAFGGSIGAGESYFQGRWDCSDLTLLVRILLQNREVLDQMDSSLVRIKGPLYQLLHWLNRNTHKGSRRNIGAHYDLGNDLFSTFLDRNMMYSCAMYQHADDDLDQAAEYKLKRICEKLDLQASDHVLEIGTGWGGFAIFAATNYGCRVTTTTISHEQYRYASDRVEREGLADRVTVLRKDYRELEGQYDKLVSIEMIEAIGHQYMPVYFRQCSRLLKPQGMMLLQAITIADQRYKQALRSVDFIQRYIFPGSFIPSVTAMQDAITDNSDMRVFDLEDIGPHYATTLRQWRERFFENISQVRELGYPEEFIRMWEFYLCYCEGGFMERAIGDVHMLLVKPACRRQPLAMET